jgi:CRAL/TRIO domain
MYGVEYESDEEAALADQIRHKISSDLMKQKAYVRGRDREGRALLIMHPRTCAETVEDEFVTTMLYLMERAIAFTEFDSAGCIEKISAVFDFASFNSSLAPSTDAIKRVASILQNSYSERLQKLVIVDPPFWMRTAWGILKPFLHPVTRAKIVMASGQKSKISVIGGIIDESEAMPFLLPTGHLRDEVELDVFTKNVPFQVGYDSSHANWTPDLLQLMDDSITSEESELTQDEVAEAPVREVTNEWQEVHV